MTTTNAPALNRRFIILLFCFAVVGTLAHSICCQPHNETSLNQLEQSNAKNAFKLVKQFKQHLKTKLWQIYNSTQLLHGSAFVNQSSESGCFGQLKTALESPVETASFEWLLQSMIFCCCRCLMITTHLTWIIFIAVYDSSGGLPNGFLSGTTISLGDFDQCLRVDEYDQFLDTQYCLLTLKARRSEKYLPFQFDEQQNNALSHWEREHIDKWLVTDNKVPIVIGMCLPSLCNQQEKDQIAHGGK